MSAPLILLVSSDSAATAVVQQTVVSSHRELRHLASDYGAMAVIQSSGPEAVLAFIDLEPTLHGYELCRAAAQHMPVVVLLGDAARDCADTAREHGACGCLHKPLEVERVRELLDETLGVRAPVEL